jgi:hypothetical protein
MTAMGASTPQITTITGIGVVTRFSVIEWLLSVAVANEPVWIASKG